MTPTGKPAQIMDALFTRAGLMESEGPELPVSLPEQAPPFEKPADGKYLEVGFSPNVPRWEGLGSRTLDQGLLQVSVVWPRGEGLIAPGQVAHQVAAHFAKGTTLYSGTTRVRITGKPRIAAPLTEPSTVTVPVTIPWTA